MKATARTDAESLSGTDQIWETLINWKIPQKVNSVLAKGSESSHHMAKDAHKEGVFTALLIF